MKPLMPQTVLYVDDEPDIRLIVRMALGLAGGVRVETAESGQRALSIMEGLQPDLVLLDVMMPTLDGPGTLMRMRSIPALEHIPVIFMTANAMPQEVARFKQMGAVGVIAKPFDPMKLAQEVLALWQTIPQGGAPGLPGMSSSDQQLRASVASLAEKFVERTRGQLVRMAEQLPGAAAGDPAARQVIRELAHVIHGSGGLFGFDRVSECARVLEQLAAGVGTDAAAASQLKVSLDRLIEALDSRSLSE